MSRLWKDSKAVSKNLLVVVFIVVLLGGGIGGIIYLRLGVPITEEPEPTPASSLLTLKLAPSTITESLTATLSGTLIGTKENKTNGLSEKTINFDYNQSGGASPISIGKAVTDSGGNFNYSWSEASSFSAGSYQVKAAWNGDNEYPRASATATLLVIPKGKGEDGGNPPPYLVVDPSSYATLNFPNGTNMGVNSKLGSSTGWYKSQPEEGWLPGLYIGSYGFESDC